MPQLIVLVGPPGSGKSTVAKTYVSTGHTYINQDSQGHAHIGFFRQAIERGEDIIVDRMGFNKQQRDRYLIPAGEAGYMTKIIVLHMPYQICLERCLETMYPTPQC